MSNKNTNKKLHSNNLMIILAIIGLGIVTTGGVVYATQTINESLHVTEQDVNGYTVIRLENPGQSNMELRTYGDGSSVWRGASIISSWNTDVDLGLVADSLTKVNDGTSDHVIWLDASSGNVGIGTITPNSELQVSGYIQLDTNSGLPPVTDCDDIDEVGRMKVDDSSLTLYVCAYDNSAYAWMTINGHSSIILPSTPSPIIISLVADDPDDGDIIYSTDDTITINFDSNTNEPGGTGIQTKTAVDNLFTFTESLGQPYRGQWTAADTFTITINGLRNVGPPVIGVTTVTPAGITLILSSDGTSELSTSVSPVLSGDFGIQ